MNSMNNVSVTGRVGQMRQNAYAVNQQGVARLPFSLAVSNYARNPDGSNGEKTVWVDVVIWGKRAESLRNIIAQGTYVGVSGKLDSSEWTDSQTGQKRSKMYISVNDVLLISRPKNAQQPQNQQIPQNQYPQQQNYQSQTQNYPPQQPQSQQYSGQNQYPQQDIDGVPFDEDIPF